MVASQEFCRRSCEASFFCAIMRTYPEFFSAQPPRDVATHDSHAVVIRKVRGVAMPGSRVLRDGEHHSSVVGLDPNVEAAIERDTDTNLPAQRPSPQDSGTAFRL